MIYNKSNGGYNKLVDYSKLKQRKNKIMTHAKIFFLNYNLRKIEFFGLLKNHKKQRSKQPKIHPRR